eukprot:CAMPEP_0113825866 /NCGR_PEP_ID=MMETSP0328-20130328/3967_1 /TAXON_ID=39455 /ORGANISM="Alexandrium minutum" /LENGTH=127 /DNA_ID=CAMNT_0000793827 /DNA_START=147 /DNA_END=526 /DNA_ORIENTATION=+ /assembly_acc=CAM_ASM_000350
MPWATTSIPASLPLAHHGDSMLQRSECARAEGARPQPRSAQSQAVNSCQSLHGVTCFPVAASAHVIDQSPCVIRCGWTKPPQGHRSAAPHVGVGVAQASRECDAVLAGRRRAQAAQRIGGTPPHELV